LLGLSMALFALEVKLVSHGAFALGGAVSFAAGSLLLFRPGDGSLAVSRWLVGGTTLATAGFFVFALGKVVQAQKRPPAHNPDAVLGATGEARTPVDGSGSVYVGGELWSARADQAIAAGEKVVVVERDGLTVKVQKA
jgi:membrane-bound serine protease (ClpP class)